MRTWFRLLTMWDLPEQTSWLKKTISPWQSKRSLISWLLVYVSTCNATIKVFWHKKIYWQKVAEISLFFLYDHMPQIVYHFSDLNRERKFVERSLFLVYIWCFYNNLVLICHLPASDSIYGLDCSRCKRLLFFLQHLSRMSRIRPKALS